MSGRIVNKKGQMDGFFVDGQCLFMKTVRPDMVTVIRGKDDDRVFTDLRPRAKSVQYVTDLNIHLGL